MGVAQVTKQKIGYIGFVISILYFYQECFTLNVPTPGTLCQLLTDAQQCCFLSFILIPPEAGIFCKVWYSYLVAGVPYIQVAKGSGRIEITNPGSARFLV